MIYDYIKKNYKEQDPILISELPGKSRNYIRQEIKKLVDEGKLKRLFNGVYYLPFTTVFGTEGKISIEKYIEKRFLKRGNATIGYITGLQLANKYGFTTQNPAVYEICSNEATTAQRKYVIDGYTIIVYKPIATISEENYKELQFLDLMSTIDKYSELKGQEFLKKIKQYDKNVTLNFSVVKKYLPLCQSVVYKNIYDGGLMNELV